MKRISITIIGMGPRGLSVFERLAAAAAHRQLPLDITLIDPGACGQGVHGARQPQYLLINTLASQVTMFPAPGAVQHAPVCATLTLTEWARQAGYRRVGERYCQPGDNRGQQIGDTDYLPRGLLGEYLGWVYQQLAAALPACVSLTHQRQRAVDLSRQPDGRWVIALENGNAVSSDVVFLTTGHGSNQPSDEEARLAQFALDHASRNRRLAFVRQVYPVVERLAHIGAGARVAIQGMGLSAHDVVAELTVGRGGEFVAGEGGLRYQRSGREPKLTLFSRHCMPFAARGINQKGLDGRHPMRYFTPDAVAALRRRSLIARGTSQLDFERDLLPLLKREMAEAYAIAAAGAAPAAPAESSVREPAPCAAVAAGAALAVAAGAAPAVAAESSIREPAPCAAMASTAAPAAMLAPSAIAIADPDALLAELLFPLQNRQFATLNDFRRYIHDWLRADLAEARKGNLASPVKAATDVLRDARATLQAIIEHGGLTPASHRRFLQHWHPAINRAAFGPPLRRNAELLALLDAGVISIQAVPGCTISTHPGSATYQLAEHPVDVVVLARLDPFSPQTDTSLLIRNMLKRGLIRPYQHGDFHPGGVAINRAGQPLDGQGQPLPNIWALGYLTEGAHYYTHALPRPKMRSRQVLDAEHSVAAMLATMMPNQRQKGRRATAPTPLNIDTLQSN